jgi:hypothetical protein
MAKNVPRNFQYIGFLRKKLTENGEKRTTEFPNIGFLRKKLAEKRRKTYHGISKYWVFKKEVGRKMKKNVPQNFQILDF